MSNYLAVPGQLPSADPLVAANSYAPTALVDKSVTTGQKKVCLLIAFRPQIPGAGTERYISSSPVGARDLRLEITSSGRVDARLRTSTTNAHTLSMDIIAPGALTYVYLEVDYDSVANGGTEAFTAALNGVEGTPISLAGQSWDLDSNDHGVTLWGIDLEGVDQQWYAVAAWYNKTPVKSEALAYVLGDDLSAMTVPPDAQINFTGTAGNYAASLSAIIGGFTWNHNSGEGAPTTGANAPTFEADAAATAPVINAVTGLNLGGIWTATFTSLDGTPSAVTINGVAATGLSLVSGFLEFTCPLDVGAAVGASVNVIVTDENGASAPVSVTLEPPDGYVAITMGTIDENSETAAAWDAGAITNEVVSGDIGLYVPSAIRIDDDGVVAFELNANGVWEIAAGSPSGLYQVTVRWQDASDSYTMGNAISQQYVFHEGPVMPADAAVEIDENTTFVGNYAAESGSPEIAYTLTGADASLFRVEQNADVYALSPPNYDIGETGPYTVNVVATNYDYTEAEYTDSTALTITVADLADGTAPVFDTPIPDQTFVSGSAWSIDVSGYASDADEDTLTFTLVEPVDGVSISSAGLLTPDLVGAGSFNSGIPVSVTVRVSDGDGGTDETTFGISTNLVTIGTLTFTSVTGANPGQSYSAVNIRTGLPEGARIEFYGGQVSTNGGATYTSVSPAYIGAAGTLHTRATAVAPNAFDDDETVTIIVNGASSTFTVATGSNPQNPIFRPTLPLRYFNDRGQLRSWAGEEDVKVSVFGPGGVSTGTRLYSATISIPASGIPPVIDSDTLGSIGDEITVCYESSSGRYFLKIPATVTDGNL